MRVPGCLLSLALFAPSPLLAASIDPCPTETLQWYVDNLGHSWCSAGGNVIGKFTASLLVSDPAALVGSLSDILVQVSGDNDSEYGSFTMNYVFTAPVGLSLTSPDILFLDIGYTSRVRLIGADLAYMSGFWTFQGEGDAYYTWGTGVVGAFEGKKTSCIDAASVDEGFDFVYGDGNGFAYAVGQGAKETCAGPYQVFERAEMGFPEMYGDEGTIRIDAQLSEFTTTYSTQFVTPEPSTWVLLATGLGFVAATARRRRR